MSSLLSLLAPIANVAPRWALLALVLQLANLVCRSLAWRNVLAGAYPDSKLSAYRVGLAYAVGVGLNGYLPARGGEAAKVALVRAQQPETHVVTVASSTTVVLLFDAAMGITLLTIGWLTGALPAPPAVPLAALGLGDGIWIVALGVGIAGELGLGALARRFGPRARRAIGDLAQGVRVLRSPLRYVRTVLSFQALAWCCRIGVVYSLLHAFGITAATLPLAALVLVVGGMSTLVPVPGGAGSQQALAVFVLSGVAGASAAFSYSVGAQIAVTLVNTTIGAIAAMLIFGRLHPLHALRDAVHATRAAAPIEPVVATSQTSA